ncbi:hypothetical protein LNV23_18940 [Paucibacter sp. DJ1R-11]|uniref:hypothetical protein n=1 Tax=Paucibacter sp. DJ1R-11 TaxID=2893556 RepID=UPI0021E4FE44|nr:hypothetical protein [Paucibacter sp. DJ1R-11]MCV2365530.1 hypothetical protein [Paucibacter sp. DJ1R-11]
MFQLGIRLSASGADDVAREAKAASDGVDRLGKSSKGASDAGSSMASVFKGALAAIGAAVSVREFGQWMQSAIDAGDEMKAFSQKTGVAVKEVAGLQLAFKQGGVDGDALTSAIGKLSKNMVEGNDAFDKMGIKTRNADGSLRSVKDVLYDVADSVREVKDDQDDLADSSADLADKQDRLANGAQKSALMQELFGKSGAALIPVLADGSEGLLKMAEMADKLGLSMSADAADAADGFNDTVELLGLSLQGVARQTMSQLLPTLNSLTGAFLDTLTEGDTLRKISDSLAAAMKLLFSSGVVVVEVFNTIGKTIGAAGAQIVAVMSGDFKGAAQIGQDYAKDVKSSWSSTATTLSKVWSDSGDKTVQALGKVVKSQRELGVQTAAEAQNQLKAAEAARKHSEELDKLAASTRAESAGLSGDFFVKWAQLNELRTTGRISVAELEAAQAKLLAQQPYQIEAAKQLADSQKRGMELLGAVTAAELKEADTVAALVEKQREHNASIGLTKEQLERLEVAKVADALATAEQRLQDALKVDTDAAVLDAITQQVEGLRTLKKLKEEGVITQATVDSAKAASEAWAKTSEDIGRGVTDSLFRAFEKGQGGLSTFIDGVKNTLKATVFKVFMQPVQAGIGSMLGMASGGASAGTGTGGMGSLMGSLNSLGSLLGNVNSSIGSFLSPAAGGLGSLMQSAGDWMTGGLGNLSTGPLADVGGWLSGTGNSLTSSAGGSMLADGMGYAGALVNLAQGKYGAAAGSAIGTYFGGPIGAAIGNALGSLADKLFAGNAGTPHMGAMYVSDSSGGYVPADRAVGNMAWGDSVHKNHSQGVEDSLKVLTGGSASVLNNLAAAFGGARDFKVGGYWAADGKDASQGDTRIWRGSQVISPSSSAHYYFAKDGETGLKEYTANMAREVRNAMGQIDLPSWAKDQLDALGTGATLDQLAQAVSAISTTQQALKGLGDFFTPLGGVFGRIAGLSADATMQLAGFAGGIDQLIGKTKSFVDNYYSADEKNAIAAGSIQRALKEAGITADLGSKDDLRALMDRADVSTEAGLKQVAALLDIAGAFAPVGDYLKEQGKTLSQLAAQAPQVALLQTLQTKTEAQVNYQAQAVEGITQLDDTFTQIGAQISAGLAAVQSAVESGLAQVTSATNASRKAWERFDDNDALTVRVVAA